MTTYSGGVPSIGTRVLTADGQELGKIKEISGTCFKVDAPMQPDYWLATDSISSGSGVDVMLNFTKANLSDAKVKSPNEHTGIHTHT